MRRGRRTEGEGGQNGEGTKGGGQKGEGGQEGEGTRRGGDRKGEGIREGEGVRNGRGGQDILSPPPTPGRAFAFLSDGGESGGLTPLLPPAPSPSRPKGLCSTRLSPGPLTAQTGAGQPARGHTGGWADTFPSCSSCPLLLPFLGGPGHRGDMGCRGQAGRRVPGRAGSALPHPVPSGRGRLGG